MIELILQPIVDYLIDFSQTHSLVTDEVFRATIYGAFAVLGGGYIFENGKQYVKVGGSNQFAGKWSGAIWFFSLLLLGWAIQQLNPYVDIVVGLFLPLTRIGIILIGVMFLYNFIVPNYNYFDWKSAIVYLIGLALAILPYIQ